MIEQLSSIFIRKLLVLWNAVSFSPLFLILTLAILNYVFNTSHLFYVFVGFYWSYSFDFG